MCKGVVFAPDPQRTNPETCPNCLGWGKDVLIGCPRKQIDPTAWDAIRAADLARRGSWPIAGGWMDQSPALVEAVRLIWAIEDTYRAELGLPPI